MGSNQVAVAIDVGATWIRGGLISNSEKIELVRKAPSRDSILGKADLEFSRTKELIRELKFEARNSGFEIVAGCIGIPEYVNPSGHLLSNDQINWTIQPMEFLPSLIDCPWVVESDVRCAAKAETKNHKDFLYVTVSSGISHAMVINGEPLRGERGMAIGLGTMPSQNPGKSVEEIASGLGMARRYLEITGREKSTQEICSDLDDSQATEIFEAASSELAVALNRAVMILDPKRIIIGGGLWLGSDRFRKSTRDKLKISLGDFGTPDITDATIRDGALIGASLFAPR